MHDAANKLGAAHPVAIHFGIAYQRVLDGKLSTQLASKFEQKVFAETQYGSTLVRFEPQWKKCKYNKYSKLHYGRHPNQSIFLQGICNKSQEWPLLFFESADFVTFRQQLDENFEVALRNTKDEQLLIVLKRVQELWTIVKQQTATQEEITRKLRMMARMLAEESVDISR